MNENPVTYLCIYSFLFIYTKQAIEYYLFANVTHINTNKDIWAKVKVVKKIFLSIDLKQWWERLENFSEDK